MALKKTIGKAGPTPGIGRQNPPMVAAGPLSVTAQGATLKDDARLMFAVRVVDDAGKPVTGLTDQQFKVWQLGHSFGEISSVFAVELSDQAGLEGVYELVRQDWSIGGNGTIPFYVRVARNSMSTGGAMTFIVKVREGLDND